MKIKICGVTSVPDALACAEAGADLIGLNFYPKSPRQVSREAARAIATALRSRPKPPGLVGVFVNETVETMQDVLADCGLNLAQLSGDESLEVLQAMGERGFKALRDTRPPIRIADYVSPAEPELLLDAQAAGMYGGTGRTADWEAAAEIARQCRLLLAGGLTPENVAAAVRQVRPWGVDVASGVESAPGVKEQAKVVAFIRAVKDATTDDRR